jgi:hypothetical protein
MDRSDRKFEMKMHNAILIPFLMTILSACTISNERPKKITAQIIGEYDIPAMLQIEISCNESKVAINNLIVFDIKILNFPVDDYYQDITIFNPLKLGTAGGLTITVVGSEKSEIFPKEEVEEQAIKPAIDISRPYFALFADHYLGARYKDSAKNIFRNPGKYFVFAEYLSPVTENDMRKHGDPKNFWGREIGPIRSAPLEIIVTE